jgi:hypothetical protein
VLSAVLYSLCAETGEFSIRVETASDSKSPPYSAEAWLEVYGENGKSDKVLIVANKRNVIDPGSIYSTEVSILIDWIRFILRKVVQQLTVVNFFITEMRTPLETLTRWHIEITTCSKVNITGLYVNIKRSGYKKTHHL